MKHNEFITKKNFFNLYRYEVPSAMVEFLYTPDEIETRTDMYDAGWDKIDNVKSFDKLDDPTKLHLMPLVRDIDEQFFIENYKDIDFRDCRLTQEWAQESNSAKILDYFNQENVGVYKMNEMEFMMEFIYGNFISNVDHISFENIESFDLRLIFNNDFKLALDEVELLIENIKFKNDSIKRRPPKMNFGFYFIDSEILEYYFGIGFLKGRTRMLLGMEYLITPAMIFDVDLFTKMMDRNIIKNVHYEARMGGVFDEKR